jgi:uncharacterized protein (UPF0261 family)
MKPTVLLIGTLDTKGRETAYVAARIRDAGCETLILDSGILGEADGVVPDFDRETVARAAGFDLQTIRDSGSRGKAVERMLVGVRSIALDLHARGQIHGVISLGGAEGSVLAAAAMLSLPFGIPKLLVSPIASGRRVFGPFVGTKDVLVMHSVVDILGLNPIAREVFDNAAAAIVGMAKRYAQREPASVTRPAVAATMLGNTTAPLMRVREALDTKGVDLVLFHANGAGGAAMEEAIEADRFQAVLDYTLSELAAEVAGGFHQSTRVRLEAAALKGLPQVIVPSCVDFIVLGPRAEVPERFRGRPSYYHNPEFTLVRVTEEEQSEIARRIASRVNTARGPVEVIVPLRGLSIANREGGEFFAPAVDAAFRNELRARLNPAVTYVEVDAHVNDNEFAATALEALERVIEVSGGGKSYGNHPNVAQAHTG